MKVAKDVPQKYSNISFNQNYTALINCYGYLSKTKEITHTSSRSLQVRQIMPTSGMLKQGSRYSEKNISLLTKDQANKRAQGGI